MNNQTMTTAPELKPETKQGLGELIRALHDSVEYHQEAADNIRDELTASMFRRIANERTEIAGEMQEMIGEEKSESPDEGTFIGAVRKIWTSFRAGLNAGDPVVVLIEAERAEDAIVAKFKEILPTITGSPINDKLLSFYEIVKAGHDSVRSSRDVMKNS